MTALPLGAAATGLTILAAVSLMSLPSCQAGDGARSEPASPVLASDSCDTRSEACNGVDDDCDGIIDEQADADCSLPHASAHCVYGSCILDGCEDGYSDCNERAADGCEAFGKCSACTDDCPPPRASDAGTQAPDTGTGRAEASPPADAQSVEVRRRPPVDNVPDAGDAADADGGSPPPPVVPTDADAGLACQGDACAVQPDSCGGGTSPQSAACACAAAHPTGQGSLCDLCVCESCPEQLAACTASMDADWNALCGELLSCFGASVQAGLCTGSDSDCYQSGNGPCAREFRNAFARGWPCTSDPVRVPCGALTLIRLDCYRTQCAAVCKA